MLKKIGLAAVLLLLAGGGWLTHNWTQVTYLPDWYSQDLPEPEVQPSVLLPSQIDDPAEIDNLAFQLQKKADRVLIANSSGRQQTPQVQLTAQEFNQLIVTTLPPQVLNPKVLAAVKAMRTEISDSQVKSGVVVDTETLPLDQLPLETRRVVGDLLQSFPVLKRKEIYIGIEGQPRLQQGKVVLGKGTRLVVGNLRLSYADLRDHINLPPEVLEKTVNLHLGQLQIQELNFQDHSAVLSGKLK